MPKNYLNTSNRRSDIIITSCVRQEEKKNNVNVSKSHKTSNSEILFYPEIRAM